MIIHETEIGGFVALSLDEEQQLANVVMKSIATRRITGEFQALLDHIYYTKCLYGGVVSTEEIAELLGFFIDNELEPPVLDQTETSIWQELYNSGNSDDLRADTKFIIRQVWREQWQEHRDIMSQVSDAYRVFPGDKVEDENTDDPEKLRDILESMFWEEVARVMEEYECNKNDAITMVSDYIPRGNNLEDFL